MYNTISVNINIEPYNNLIQKKQCMIEVFGIIISCSTLDVDYVITLPFMLLYHHINSYVYPLCLMVTRSVETTDRVINYSIINSCCWDQSISIDLCHVKVIWQSTHYSCHHITWPLGTWINFIYSIRCFKNSFYVILKLML